VCDGDQTGQELLVESLRVMTPELLGVELDFVHHDLSLERRRATNNDVVREAAAAMRNGEVERGHITLRRAELIVGHLDGTLDFNQGLVAERLHAIYMFCLEQLSSSRFTQDAGMLDDVNDLLGELREAWSQIADEPVPL